jgi:hypothetical protein
MLTKVDLRLHRLVSETEQTVLQRYVLYGGDLWLNEEPLSNIAAPVYKPIHNRISSSS